MTNNVNPMSPFAGQTATNAPNLRSSSHTAYIFRPDLGLLEGWHGWWWRKFSEGTLGVCLLKTEAIKNVIEAAPKRLRDQ